MKIIKENITTITLVIIIAIILLIIGVFCCEIINTREKDDSIEISEVKEITSNDWNGDTRMQINENISNEDNNIEEESFEPLLTQIVEKFNTCDATQEMIMQGYYMNATTTKNNINIFSSGDDLGFNVNFVLNDNILSTQIITNESEPRLSAIEMALAILLVDCVGQTKGYQERSVSKVLGTEPVINGSIIKDGIELKQLEDGRGVSIKVDINSNFSFLKD